ncbi:hypothetical protein BURPS305_5455 [Burkholderia pseudomallei 305]|nr:hypothetical protein BURPS305_5455 [Burkholderia pseudomallei 305]
MTSQNDRTARMLKQHSMRAELSFNSHLYATALQFSILFV